MKHLEATSEPGFNHKKLILLFNYIVARIVIIGSH